MFKKCHQIIITSQSKIKSHILYFLNKKSLTNNNKIFKNVNKNVHKIINKSTIENYMKSKQERHFKWRLKYKNYK